MRIRSQLNLLVIAVVAPIALVAAVLTFQLWSLQREAYSQRILERVSALRLALDTELEGIQRSLRGLAEVPALESARGMPGFAARFPRLLASNPAWATIGVVLPDGQPFARYDRGGRAPLPPDAVPDAPTIAAVAKSRDSAISSLVTTADGRAHMTYVAVPVLREGEVRALVYVGIESGAWLEFLKRYPIAQSATLTLNDVKGRIIARTLNNERWVGKFSSPGFWKHTEGRVDHAFLGAGLEGQKFYSAFSRSRVADWLMTTGVPLQDVESALRGPTLVMGVGIALAAALAVLLAVVFGRRIAGAMTSLASAARATGDAGVPPPQPTLDIDEAETVRRALQDSAALLRAREAALSEALRNEAALRAGAEQESQAKDQFLAMLSHELRNPLSAMSTAAVLLEMPAAGAAEHQRAREVLRRQLRHLTGIVDDLLDVARLASGKVVLKREVVDLGAVARHVAASFSDAGRCRHVTLKTSFATAPVFADETRLEQVVGNLLDNACKYTPEGREVELQVRGEAGEAVVSVRDTGTGIAPELLPRVFDIFAQGTRTMDRAQGGLGLGLTVVQKLVALHGGKVSAQSEGLDRGSTFTVRLPLVSQAKLAEPARAGSLPPRRIVVVEDNADSRESMATMLRLLGHEVGTAADGPSGVKAILDARPDIALVDLGLPGLDGLSVARQVRASPGGGQALLFALTGYGSEADHENALAAGFDGFLIKPFDLKKFEQLAHESRPAP